MKRREFIKGLGAGALVTGGALGAVSQAQAKSTIKWKMVTTWPKNFPGLGTGANLLAKLITEMSGGRLRVKVYGAKELVPAFEVFDAVSRGTAEMGHGAAYYWKGKSEAAQFFSTVPFGMTAQEMNGWMYYGDGLKLWRELYDGFGLVPAPAGNTGVQMGGWFNKQINSVDDLKGLKMRIPGLGGEVLRRAGGTPVNLPGGELFTSLKSGAIDATEWVNPYNDLAFGLFKAAKYYYYPGFHEPGTTLEAIINKEALQTLPKDLQSIVLNACKVVNQEMLAEYTARNPAALRTLVEKHKVDIRSYPDDVLATLRRYSEEVVTELAAKDAFSKKVFDSYSAFLKGSREWGGISNLSYLMARDKV
ncbi:TRAP transporter substrate-binding protein [endosymbiont of Riftia pachyptila]|uniref:TRAP transporter solute receptor n=1 Tax=endosymbiont of Riftia pachyptila (vent Ph05) TaxID=1048808 RepID=G2D960_9GAMM|nr:TRAP transporter substrate-binding protein [endosymbiont of Riftia pachyptila]EGV52927.1 TRAP transporter solute receptor [endosymbiont of Riftia pachyptila (vent Ph05)]